MRVALYARVSTDEQSPLNQVAELRRWAEGQGHKVVEEYVDFASGARRRERLDDLFDDARRRKFDIVAIWSLDRLTREGPLATLLYVHRLTTPWVSRSIPTRSHTLTRGCPSTKASSPSLPTSPGGREKGVPIERRQGCGGLSPRARG